jgi:hypothetical protein
LQVARLGDSVKVAREDAKLERLKSKKQDEKTGDAK